MIELRWLVIDKPRLGAISGTMLIHVPRLWKVLQMRQITNPLEIGLHEPIWTEWKDIPVISGKLEETKP